MTKPVRLDPAAEDELADAEAWYEERAGLGGDLVAAVREAGDRIAERPHSFPFAHGVPSRLEIRRCPVRRFPYGLCFLELPDEIRVLAVAHNRRRPFYWRKRVGAQAPKKR
jgi:plasmid stabilization system protein ParE